MKINLLFLFVYFLCLNITAQEKAVAPEEIVLTLDAENKKITFPVQFISNEQMLEVFACTEQGPIHETVLLIQPLGVKLREALKKIGLTEAIHWQYPLEEGFQLAMGDKVVMKIFFEGKKESEAVYVEDLLVYNHTETPCFLRGWSFKGDQVTVEGKVSPTPEVEFSLINKGRQKSPTTLLLNPSNFFQIDEPEYKVATKYKPLMKKMNDPNKTKGTIVLIPATEEFIATENAKRYEDKTGLLTRNIEIAKKVDAAAAGFAEDERVLVTASFARMLEATRPDRAAELAPAGEFTDARVRQHTLFTPDPRRLAARRNRLGAYALAGILGILLLGIAGREVNRRFFPPRPAVIEFDVRPRGEVVIDGVSHGRTPPLREVELAPGRHHVRVRSGNYPPLDLKVKLEAGERMTVTHTFAGERAVAKPGGFWRDMRRKFGL